MTSDPGLEPTYEGLDTEPPEEAPLPSRHMVRKRGRWVVRVVGEDEERVALDLSLGGLFLAGVVAPPDTEIELVLVFGPAPADQLVVGATVRWSRQGRLVPRALRGVGVAFHPLDEGARARIVAELERTP
ncbi:MAG: PilZ domain-containing protein [Myxococcota bacterium]